MRHNRVVSVLIVFLMMINMLVITASAENEIKLIIDGQERSLSQEIYLSNDGTVYVPLIETFTYLGINITKNYDNAYIGAGANGEIVITVGKDTAEVDWVDIELPAPVIEKDGTVMVPAYLIEDAVKTQMPVYDAQNRTLSIISPDNTGTGEDSFDIGKVIETLPEGERIITQDDLYGSNAYGEAGWEYLEVKKGVSINLDGYTDALQLKTREMPYGEVPAVSNIAYRVNLTGKQDMKKGDVAVIHFKARATEVTDESGKANLVVLYERTSDWNKMGSAQWRLDCVGWKDYYLPLYAEAKGTDGNAQWLADESHIKFCVGGKPQTIQITGFELIYYGSDKVDIVDLMPEKGSPYYGMSEDALWRKEAYKRIEKYRKDDVTIRVKDEKGNPVQGAKIEVNQTENEFIFGVSICNDEILNLDTSTVGGKIQDEVLDCFNTGVCGLEMKPRYMNMDGGANGVKMVNDFLSRGMRMRGHALMWDSDYCMDFISETGSRKDLSYEEIYRRVYDYVLPTAYMFKGKIAQWDVLNEPHDSNFIRTTYGTRLYTDIFNAVHEIDPDAKLYVNETGIEGKNKGMSDRIPALVDIVKGMKDKGAHIDGIGIQAHCANYFYPQGLYRQLDECAQVVDEVAITEYDFYNENMEYAPEHLRDSMIVAFSHPKGSAFVLWGYYDTIHWRNVGAFYDSQWNEKPAKAMWDHMVNEEFKTKLSITTDENGKADFRGFHGDYEITVRYNGKEEKFTFGLKNNTENYIDIKVNNNISANVSSGKYIEIPSEITYETVDDAAIEFEENYNPMYISLLLESRFRGVAGDDLVSKGGNLNTDDSYVKGEKWGSKTGMSLISSDSADGMIFNNDETGTFSMSHKYNGDIFDQGNMEMNFRIETFNSTKSGFTLNLSFTEGDFLKPTGRIKTTASGYCIETLSGNKIRLNSDSVYDVYITIAKSDKPSVYDIIYTVEQNGKVVTMIKESQREIIALKNMDGVLITAECTGTDPNDVIKIKNARVKFYTDEQILDFSSINHQAELINENMRRFDTADVVSETDDEYIYGNSWGSNTTDIENSFRYMNYGKYLYGVRNTPAGEQRLNKKLGTLSEGETLDIEFDYYINAPYVWFNSMGYFDVRLESADRNTARSLVKFEYSRKDYGFRVNFLGNSEKSYELTEQVEWGDESKYNKNNLHIKCTIEENEKGEYDAFMNIRNAKGIETELHLEDVLTKEEFTKIDTFVIANQTISEGTRYGETIAGIKNILVTKKGRIAEESNQISKFQDGEFGGIQYSNLTQKPFNATILLGGYKNGQLVSASTYNFESRDEKSGFLSIPVHKTEANEEKFKVFLIEDTESMRPFKTVDEIEVLN